MKPADPLDLAVASAFRRTEAVEPPVEIARHQIARSMVAKALALSTFSPRAVAVAEIIFGFDQEAIEQPWSRLTEHRRQPYYDIAEAVLAHLGLGTTASSPSDMPVHAHPIAQGGRYDHVSR